MLGTPLIAPDLYEASRCIAMTNSVTSSVPRPCVSARFHIRPSTSFGNRALSKICFATSPDKDPFSAPDFSNKAEYSATFSGVSAGTRIGAGPVWVGLEGVPLYCAWIGAIAGATGWLCCGFPSNLGKGAAVQSVSQHLLISSSRRLYIR